MDFDVADREEAFRKQVRAWLDANVPDALRGRSFAATRADRAAVERLRAWQKRMWEAGFVGMDWPPEFGGRGASILEQLVLYEELARAEAPQFVNRGGLSMLGPTLMAYGTPAQQRRFLPRILTADEIWCQGFRAPDGQGRRPLYPPGDRRPRDRRAMPPPPRLSQPDEDPPRRRPRPRGLDGQALLEPARPGAGRGRDPDPGPALPAPGGHGAGARRRPVGLLRAPGAGERDPRRHLGDPPQHFGRARARPAQGRTARHRPNRPGAGAMSQDLLSR